MLPIRSLSPGSASRLAGFAVLLLLAGAGSVRVGAAPLPADGVEEFRRVLLQDRSFSTDDPLPVEVLVERRRDLQGVARRLPSLGEVARVLLLPEWGATDLVDLEPIVPLDQVEAAVRQPDDESFKRDVRKLVKMAKDNAAAATNTIAVEIKRMVRLTLLERLDQRLRFYLRSGRTADRIAAANLVSETMSNARKQDNAELPGGGRKAATLGSRFLRQRLRELTGDLTKLTLEADPEVQVASVRALSDLEIEAAASVAALRPLLNPARYSVLTRRATAEAFAHIVEIIYQQMDKGRPQPTLKSLEQIFPAAASGLADADEAVRRASLTACQRAATTLEELIVERKTPVGGLPVYRPMVAAVQKALPDLNRVAQDPVPELRVNACHLLETLVLTAQKVRQAEGSSLPPPRPEPGKDSIKPVPLPSVRAPRRRPARSGQWAAARLEPASRTTLLTPVPYRQTSSTPAVTLDRPVKLSPEPSGAPPAVVDVRPAAFVAPRIEELPQPAQAEMQLKGTVQAMIDGLGDADYRVRLASVDVLETFGDRAAAAIPALVKALSDRNKFVRWAAARTLGRLADRATERKESKEVVAALVRLLNDREDASVRITAAYALELYGSEAKGAVPHLARVINRGDKEYIIAILHTLQGIGTDARIALPNVAWVLRNRDLPASVRIEAAQTLGRFGALAMGQLGSLREVMVNDPDESVRHAAGDAVLAVERAK